MISRRKTLAFLILALTAALADTKAAPQAKPKPITTDTRFNVVRSVNAELVYVRKPFPMGEKGLTMRTDGTILPSEAELSRLLAQYGPAAHAGDRVRITDVIIKEHSIIFEINGGPKKKKKWWQHVQIGGMGGMTTVGPEQSNVNPRGSKLTLEFPDYVPEMTIEQLKAWLAPVFDFRSVSATQAYLDMIPPKAKEAIKNHKVLVGMDRQMVINAKGRPPRKIREKDGEVEYEEWIYGEPPQDVEFVRFVGDEVVRLEIMKVTGEKEVRTEKELELQQAVAQKPETEPATAPPKAPSLRRPAEEATPQPQPTVRVPIGTRPEGEHDPTTGPPRTPPPQNVPPPPPGSDPGAPH